MLPGEPLCFLHFIRAYPWLDAELDAFVPRGRSGSNPPQGGNGAAASGAAGSGAEAAGGFAARANKRQRLGPGGSPGPGAVQQVVIEDD